MAQTFEYPAWPRGMFLVRMAAPENLVSTVVSFVHHQTKSVYDREEPQLARATFNLKTKQKSHTEFIRLTAHL